jgi:hypothetical protein
MRGKRLDDAMIATIRKEAADGATFQQISAKHGISWATVQYHVEKNGKKPAGGKTARATNGNGKAKQSASGNGHFHVELTLGGLDAIWSSLLPEKKAELLKGL